MPPNNSVQSLTSLTGNIAWKILMHAGLIFSPANRELVRRYTCKILSSFVRQQVILQILPIENLDLSRKFLLLEVFGDRSTRFLDVTACGILFVDEVFQLYRVMNSCLMINVSKFGFMCKIKARQEEKYIPDLNSIFYRVLCQMSQLQWLTIGGMADNEIMAIIGNNCPNLEYLDVRDSSLVTDDGIHMLVLKVPANMEDVASLKGVCTDDNKNICCNKLRFIGISGTSVSTDSVYLLLLAVPHLFSFGGYVYEASVSCAINILSGAEQMKFELCELWDKIICISDAGSLTNSCSNLNRITTCGKSLQALKMFSLKHATIDCDFQIWKDEIYDYLSVRGDLLETLTLVDGIVCPLDIEYLCELTPNLKELDCFLECSSKEGAQIKWKKLETARLVINSSLCLSSFLLIATQVRTLSLLFEKEPYMEDSLCINDDLILNSLNSGGLYQLEKLSVGPCGLTMVTVDALILQCLNLKYLGKLYNWGHIREEEVVSLNKRVMAYNWNLKVEYF